MALALVRHSERPELWDRIPERFAGVVPEYNLHGDINGDYWNRLFDDFPEFQFVLYDDEHDTIVGAGRSLPRTWDGTAADLGPGLDDSIARAFADRDAGRAPDALCALGIEVAEDHQGRGCPRCCSTRCRTRHGAPVSRRSWYRCVPPGRSGIHWC